MTRDRQTSIQVESSNLNIASLVKSFGADQDFKHQLEQATVLIVPTDLRPAYDGPCFPSTTRDVFRHLRDSLSGQAVVNAAVRDEDYVEYGYHADEILLPIIFVAKDILLPLVISYIASYVHDACTRRGGSHRDDKVKSELHFKGKDGTQLLVKYDGPSKTFERVMLQCCQDLGVLPNDEEEQQVGSDDAS